MYSNNAILGLSYKKLSSKIAKTRTIIWIKITVRVTEWSLQDYMEFVIFRKI